MQSQTSLKRFRRHAELYGSEEVYDVAAGDGLDSLDLARLALALRHIDPRWRLSADQRANLLGRLDGFGLPDQEVRRYLGVSQDTLRRMREPAC